MRNDVSRHRFFDILICGEKNKKSNNNSIINNQQFYSDHGNHNHCALISL